ncbi:MAG: SusC/RagA family TonB-linked outer membrane protein, partial [Ferruginibacter sp.]
PVITFNANTAISKLSNLTKTVDASQYIDYIKTAYLNGYFRSKANPDPNIDPFTTTDPFFSTVKLLKSEYDKGYNTNWANELFKTAVVQNYDFGIRGGANNIRYAVSAGYLDQKGILDNSSFKRYSFRLNTDYTLGKHLVVGENLNIAYSSVLGGASYAEGYSNGIVAQILQSNPLFPVLNPAANPNDPDYQYNKYAAEVTGFGNPAAMISRVSDRNNSIKLLGNVYGELEILKGLKLRSSMGYDYQNVDFSSFNPRYFISGTDQYPTSQVTQNNNYFLGQVWENTLSYNTKIADHVITGLLGYTEELYKGKFTNVQRQGTANNDPSLQVLNAATGAINLTGNKTNYALRSYFARANYSYADRYLVTATVRRDGSSKFASEKRWGTFPSVSAGWRISNEKFFKNLNTTFISSLKLRAGWGQIGNQSMPGGTNNPYLSLVEGINNYRYIFGDGLANGNYLTSLGTPSITWETAQQTNVGVDLALIKNKLTVTADYFVRNTKDMLLQVQLPSNAGFPSIPYTNAGEVQNKGYEIAVSYQGKAGQLNYTVSANASHFINKVISLGVGNKPIIYNDAATQLSINRTEAGRSIGEFQGWVTDGIFQNMAEVNAFSKSGQKIQPNALPGDFRFRDINDDGVIDAKDRTWIGNPNPKLLYGFNLNLGYKHFDLSALFQGSYGNKLFTVNKKYFYKLSGSSGAALSAYEAAWKGEGTSNTQPIMSTIDRNDNFRVSDWYVQDGSYLRLKNLQIGYTISESFLKRAGITSSRVWLGGTDLFTITKYKGNDPEAGLSANPLATGWEFSSYPKIRRFSVGINVTL